MKDTKKLVEEVLAGKNVRAVFYESKINFKEYDTKKLQEFLDTVDVLHKIGMQFVPENIVSAVEEELNKREGESNEKS